MVAMGRSEAGKCANGPDKIKNGAGGVSTASQQTPRRPLLFSGSTLREDLPEKASDQVAWTCGECAGGVLGTDGGGGGIAGAGGKIAIIEAGTTAGAGRGGGGVGRSGDEGRRRRRRKGSGAGAKTADGGGRRGKGRAGAGGEWHVTDAERLGKVTAGVDEKDGLETGEELVVADVFDAHLRDGEVVARRCVRSGE